MKLLKAGFGDTLDWAQTGLAGMVLLNIGLRFWRPPAGFDGLDYLGLGIAALGIATIWILNLKQRLTLNKMREHADDKALALLNTLARQSAFWGYLMMLAAMAWLRRH